MEERTAKCIHIEYEDGTVDEVAKGFAARYSECDGKGTSTFDLVGMSGRDLKMLVLSVIELGVELGFFREEDD